MVKFIAFTMYPVTDLARARKFYEEGLGLEFTHADPTGKWVEYHLENGCFAITSMATGVTPSASSGGSIAFEVDDVDATVKKLEAAGGRLKIPVFDTRVCRDAIMLDTEGNAFVVHKRVKPYGV